MALAIFDLDNTLIAGDSDHAWGDFLVEQGIVDKEIYQKANDRFYQEYLNGELDMMRYLEFSLAPLQNHPVEALHQWRRTFVESKIKPVILEAAQATVERHRKNGDFTMIITATNRFITEPIALLFNVDHLIATDLEMRDGQYTGKVSGTPSFQEGKVSRLQTWLDQNNRTLKGSWFYSDSHNDLPLLKQVDHPVAVDPDERLKAHALENHWQLLTFRQAAKDSH
ncbi:MAG: HAD-IB family hydrolase [Proteobacteria bacterium]|nr:MAG: HAD-IB family hydrolase [Pseudomonadota bacterium]